MRDWLASVWAARLPEVALGLAFGYALVTLADNIVRIPVSILAQHAGRHPSGEDDTVLGLVDLFTEPYHLNFDVGGTVVVYGEPLAATLSLGLVGLAAWLVVRRRDRELGICPFCASRIPYESTHCAYCGSGISPADQ